ncbi:M16 family metallopeptidase [Methylohalobius crimeensis]|uniref:M16 family metallopeptidase n=1 Tax=Methylohalobius crimeensis TaxID=244365 RepID=UPI0003B7737C|nr:pitrilysin family protein [Methylohalobius crimeensis]
MFIKRGCVFILLLLGTMAAWAGPKIEHWRTPEGVRVYYVHNPELPLVDIQVLFAAGSARDGEKHGLAALTATLLDTGAGDWDASAIAGRLENVGAQLSTGASRDAAWLQLRSLTEADKLRVAVSTAREILANPRFSEQDFNREKKRLLMALKRREESPARIAGVQFFDAIYGDHPYAHPSEGHIPTVQAIQREDLEAFHRRYYAAENALVVIVGALDRSQAKQLADRLMGGLPRGEAAPPIEKVAEVPDGGVRETPFPSAQTHIYTGMPVITRGDPDYFPLYVGNHVLGGGGFTSRLVKEVREKRGLSYSVASYFMPMQEKGPYLASLQVRNDQAQAALEVLHQTIHRFLKEGPTEEELTAAKKNIIGSFVLNYDSNADLTEYVGMVAFYGLPLDYLDTFPARVKAVTRRDIVDAFSRRLDPDRFQTVLVGGAVTEPPAADGQEK